MTTFDVAIVGAGPIGLEIAAGLTRAGLRPERDFVQLDAGGLGHTMSWWAEGTTYFSSPERIALAGIPLITPGQQKANREQYLDYLRTVAGAFDLRVRTFTRVVGIERGDDGFTLRTRRSTVGVGGRRWEQTEGAAEPWTVRSDDHAVHARRLVLAIGDMHQARRLDVPGEDLPHVSHYLDDPHRYVGRRVLIVGGKNSAVEAAIRLYRIGARVSMSYRRADFDEKRVKYWLLPELKWLLRHDKIHFHPRTAVSAIDEESVVLAPAPGQPHAGNGEAERVGADDVLLLIGYEQDPTLFQRLGIELAGSTRHPVFDDTTMETNIPGVYVAGTATAGTQERTKVFIETSHVHVERICEALTGQRPGWAEEEQPVRFASLEES